MTVSVVFGKGSSFLQNTFFACFIVRTILGDGLVHNGVLFLEGFLDNGYYLLELFLLYIMFLIALDDMIYVRDSVPHYPRHDIDRTQVVNL